jgi:hypothetical protein
MKDIRQRMIEDMKLRKLTPGTQATYLEAVRVLVRHYNRRLDEITQEQVRDFLLYLIDSKGYAKSTYTVLNYLAHYIHRVAITNSRIISADNGKVTFRYKESKSGARIKTMTVSAEEFIRRFLQHVLPAGVHKVRYYGLWSSSNRKKLSKVQQILTQLGNDQQARFEEDTDAEAPPPSEARPCPHCQRGTLIWIGRLPRQGRAPP